MLVMSRKKSEVIVVGNSAAASGIRIVVLEIQGGQVKLGIEAPDYVPVHRLEVWQQANPAQNPRQPK